jgi:isopentenyl phosphate kinase
MSRRKITPISFGDVVYRSNLKFSILSGDELMTILASVLRPAKVIFAINVDGIYNNLHDKRLLPSFDENKSARFLKVEADVTGGMMRKVHEALKISKMGLDVWLVNGFKPSRIAKILRNEKTEGTVIKGKKGIT